LIRSATPADIPSLITLERQCASAAHWTEEQYRQAFQSQEVGVERLVLVSECSDAAREVDGFLVALNLGPEWELENIVVAPAARRNRLATRLLDALFVTAAEQKSDAVFLEVRESNVAARTLYEKVGLEQTGRRKSYYANPAEDAVLYRRALRRRD
jgi:ribosomal-protein-alanine N-acetyltransferase